MQNEITVKQASLIAAMVMCRDIPVKWNSAAIDSKGEIDRPSLISELSFHGCRLESTQGGYFVRGLS